MYVKPRQGQVELPIEIYTEKLWERSENDAVVKLNEAVQQYAMAAGKPLWLLSAEHDGDVLVQFGDSLVEMNLGDGGVMYVFKDTAFWQCH
ncbi:MAG: hypothetical protein ACI9BW_004512 [Gammaproteobacteria bacterium]|jgi:hypothetical protein